MATKQTTTKGTATNATTKGLAGYPANARIVATTKVRQQQGGKYHPKAQATSPANLQSAALPAAKGSGCTVAVYAAAFARNAKRYAAQHGKPAWWANNAAAHLRYCVGHGLVLVQAPKPATKGNARTKARAKVAQRNAAVAASNAATTTNS